VAASKQIEKWDFKRVQPWAGKKEIELYVVPTRGQHFSGQAERMSVNLKKHSKEVW
jgi:hypothetical protein